MAPTTKVKYLCIALDDKNKFAGPIRKTNWKS